MALTDNDELRRFLVLLYPGLIIEDTPSPSGQRVVYYCHFDQETCEENEWTGWGNVVLKISEGISAQSIAYIQKEIEILSNMDNPGYPKLLLEDVISEDPETEDKYTFRRYITIEERINAKPLSEIKDQFSSEEDVVQLLLKLIFVLKPLWNSSPPLIHRDLKPANILITPENNVVVIDLGIVREEGGDGVTMSAQLYGPCTPSYASPEQAMNDKRHITFKSDVFSLGVMSYELISGENPFNTETNLLDEILENVIKLVPETLHSKELCSAEFSALIDKMMQKHPFKRHRKIETLEEELNLIGNQ